MNPIAILLAGIEKKKETLSNVTAGSGFLATEIGIFEPTGYTLTRLLAIESDIAAAAFSAGFPRSDTMISLYRCCMLNTEPRQKCRQMLRNVEANMTLKGCLLYAAVFSRA